MLDYKLTEDGDLYFDPVTGDLALVESTAQHQLDLLMADKGHYREHVDVGVGLTNWLEDDELGDLPGVITEEFEKDGMTIAKVTVTESGKLTTDASY